MRVTLPVRSAQDVRPRSSFPARLSTRRSSRPTPALVEVVLGQRHLAAPAGRPRGRRTDHVVGAAQVVLHRGVDEVRCPVRVVAEGEQGLEHGATRSARPPAPARCRGSASAGSSSASRSVKRLRRGRRRHPAARWHPGRGSRSARRTRRRRSRRPAGRPTGSRGSGCGTRTPSRRGRGGWRRRRRLRAGSSRARRTGTQPSLKKTFLPVSPSSSARAWVCTAICIAGSAGLGCLPPRNTSRTSSRSIAATARIRVSGSNQL